MKGDSSCIRAAIFSRGLVACAHDGRRRTQSSEAAVNACSRADGQDPSFLLSLEGLYYASELQCDEEREFHRTILAFAVLAELTTTAAAANQSTMGNHARNDMTTTKLVARR
jgi:hypothetical protein